VQPGLDLTPIPLGERRATVLDVAFLFAGANVVATTLVTGGSIGAATSPGRGAGIVVLGAALGTLPLALLARLGPRTGLPSMVLLRQPFGASGAAAISLLLVLTNFAWIALNNVIAASALHSLVGGPAWWWSLLVGAVATVVALTGPRAMVLFDRAAVPAMAVLGVVLTVALFGMRTSPDAPVAPVAPGGGLGLLAGLDLVVGYQVSWSLMFADYTRYQKRERAASLAVFVGLTASSLWLMLVGAAAGRLGGGNDPTAMILSAGLPTVALAVVVLSTVTTNFVNLYLSSLATRNLWPQAPPVLTVLTVGAVGTGLGLADPALLGRYAGFMEVLGTLLLPIVAVVAVHYFVPGISGRGRTTVAPRLDGAAVFAWLGGAATYQLVRALVPELGATLPALAAAAGLYLLACRLRR
jgi:purine-cytosine permease-like protein